MKASVAVLANGLTRVGLGQHEIDNLELPCPPCDEQGAISDFLQRETAKVDALVAEQEQLIERLSEQRYALISDVVVRGRDRAVSMRSSGVEWIGDMPAHWRLLRLKRISPRISGRLVYQPAQYFASEGIPFLMGNNITERGVKWDSLKYIPESVNEQFAAHALREGDVVTVRVGAPGVTCVVPAGADGLNCGSLMIIRRSPDFDSHWLATVMNSAVVRRQIESVQYGAAQEQINIADAVDFVIPTPPIGEQREIHAAVASASASFDALSASAGEAMSLLRERRSALISAAVTGQIDVRGLVRTEAA